MIKTQRQQKLIELLSENEVMEISNLSKILNTSMMTVRRDLESLESEGIVKKVHGGALLLKKDYSQPSFQQRLNETSEEKIRIGKEAAKLIRNGSIVCFDAGTTPLAVVEHIPEDLEFTAITTGLMTAIALCERPNANVINVGGNIHHSSYSSINYIAVKLIEGFNADLAFISTKAISLPEGTYEAQLPLIEVKKALVSVSKKVVLLADHSKFQSRSLCLSIPLDDIHTIITDGKTPETILKSLNELGKEVIVV